MMRGTAPEGAGDVRRYILLLAAAGGAPIAGRDRMQMLVFMVLDRKDRAVEKAGYVTDGDGPYSDIVDRELDGLVRAGMMSEGGPMELTPKGAEAAAELAGGETERMLTAVESCRERLDGLTRDEALAFICCAYPQMRESDAYRRLEPRLGYHIVSLKEKHRITAARGAELLGIRLADMWGRMTERGIPLPGAEDGGA